VKLYDLLREVRSVPTDNFRFLTVPRTADLAQPDRDVLRQPAANELFKRLRLDRPLADRPAGAGEGAAADDHAPPGADSAETVCK
jgi:hypothetical protein